MKNRLYELDWSFPDSTPTTESIKKYCIGSVLNVCCGKSKMGLTVDLDPTMNPQIIADCKNLPFRKNSFDTVIIDPPYQYFCTGEDRF